MGRTVFCATPAIVGQVNGTVVKFWLKLGITDPTQLKSVDLAKNTNHDVATAEVDAEEPESPTHFGMVLGQLVGKIYVKQSLMAAKGLSVPPPGFTTAAFGHEFQMVHIPVPFATTRYFGFQAEIVSDGPPLKVKIFHAGQSKSTKLSISAEIDLNSTNATGIRNFDMNVKDGGLTEIAVSPRDSKGALYIEYHYATDVLGLRMVKLPSSAAELDNI